MVTLEMTPHIDFRVKTMFLLKALVVSRTNMALISIADEPQLQYRP